MELAPKEQLIFLKAEASRDILKFRVLEIAFTGVFHKALSTVDGMLFCQNTLTQDWEQCHRNVPHVP